MAEKDKNLKDNIERMEWEFSMLYEVSNAMRTTLKLDQVFYIILTSFTGTFLFATHLFYGAKGWKIIIRWYLRKYIPLYSNGIQ